MVSTGHMVRYAEQTGMVVHGNKSLPFAVCSIYIHVTGTCNIFIYLLQYRRGLCINLPSAHSVLLKEE